VLQRTLALSEHPIIEGREILFEETAAAAPAAATGDDTLQAMKALKIAEVEQKYIREKLAAHQGNVTKVAEEAGTDRRSMQRMIDKHHIETDPYSPRPSTQS